MSFNLKLAIIFTLCFSAQHASAVIVGGTDANNPVYLSGNTAVGFSSVPGAGVCSGSLLNSGMHYLTAAHCILGNTGTGTVTFTNANNVQFSYSATSLVAHPDFNPSNFWGGSDLAIITLNQVVDSSIARLSLYTGTGELNQVGTLIGRGGSGTGTTGGTLSSGVRREGTNTIDTIVGNNILFYDFDDGTAARNSLGSATPTAREAMIYFGDSGGPTLLNGQIAGIHSFITCVGGTTTQCAFGPNGPDLDGTINGTFGERFGDTRVSVYANWIQGIAGASASSPLTPQPITFPPAPSVDPPASVPEPSTIAAGFLASLICLARYRKTHSGSAS